MPKSKAKPNNQDDGKVIEAEPKDSIGSDFLDDQASKAIDDKPPVSEHAIKAVEDDAQSSIESEPETQPGIAPTGPVYSPTQSDTAFDPELHCVDANGQPIRTKAGGFRRKPGRKPGHLSGVIPGSSSKADEVPQAAQLTVACLEILGRSVFGSEWEMLGDEKPNLESAFRDYYYATGVIKIPPWLGLTIAIGSYAIPRFQMPGTQARIGKVIALISGKKIAKVNPNVSHTDSRNNGSGQIDTRKDALQDPQRQGL